MEGFNRFIRQHPYQIDHDKDLFPSQPLEVLCQESGVQRGGSGGKQGQRFIRTQHLDITIQVHTPKLTQALG